jgi:hypothetical protein
MMNRPGLAIGVALSALAVATAAGQPQPFTAGNLVLLQVGDGTAAVTSAAQPVFLKEFTTLGALVQTVPVPTETVGNQRRLTQNGTATSEGFLTRSVNGEYLVLVGYDAAPAQTNPATSSSADVNRVVGRIAADGSIDTSTAISDAYGGSNFRSAVTIDGSAFWTAGNASTAANAGVRYVTLGNPSGTTEPLSTTGTGFVSNVRVIDIHDDQIHISAASGALLGVGTLGGSPPPTTGTEAIIPLPGMPPAGTSPAPSAYQFFFADSETLYIADDRTLANGGGLQKWVMSGGLWALETTFNAGLTTGIRNITGVVDGGVTTIYALTAGSASAGSALIFLTDIGAASEFTTIFAASPSIWFKGIAFAPVSSTPPACYANCDGSTTEPILNVADFTCFLSKFAAGDPYANCDGSTTEPILNVADFTCFLSKFAAGC